jgi:glycosyltransferase involved in cell wall biosynthesis
MRVLLVSHTCQSPTEGQPRAERLGRIPDLELRVLSPDRWLHYGKLRQPHVPQDASFGYEVGQVMWPWVGPAQYYLHWYPRLATLLKEFRPDIIDLWEEPWGLVSAHACLLRNRLLPQTRIVSETEQNINKSLPLPFERMRSYTLRNANFAVGRNSEAIEVLRSKGYNGPAEVVPNAVDAELFRP